MTSKKEQITQAADASFTLKSSIDTEHSISSFERFVLSEDGVTLMLARNVEARLNRACFYRFIDEFITSS
ncbi:MULTISPECIES: hypothetical protein [unclassified Shewanella]|uniref:hypothetical protein n=1 Tax=unclassified Shewanella TaxID=196818 RepID=UPI001BC06986|nr:MULTISPECIES: hypothetical protein [unclassified Shewanella]GIU12880.1 hypothetical protein TUM4444_20810 [Shewanella sp. MBTL60-112-B1]GIU38241.1 hypothetical protein TUM4445_32020 [Shewanella sp. MBTL60-112-B2]